MSAASVNVPRGRLESGLVRPAGAQVPSLNGKRNKPASSTRYSGTQHSVLSTHSVLNLAAPACDEVRWLLQ